MMVAMASEPPTLGMRIRRARERARLSQEGLAAAVGVSVRAVGDWENDRRLPRNRIGALEDVLGVDLTGPPEPRPRIPKTLLREIENEKDLTPEERQAVIDAIERTLSKEDGLPGLALQAEPERRRPAS